MPTALRSLILLPILCQCAGGAQAPRPGLLSPGARAEAVYQSGGISLSLRNESWADPEQVYSNGRSPNLKIARDADMDRLLGALTESGFFAAADAAPAPGAQAWLSVTIGDKPNVMSRLPTTAATIENNRLFNSCVQSYRYVYDNTVSFHTGGKIDRESLQEQNERVRREAREALERLQEKR